MQITDKIIIVGAGLCGTLLALRLAQKGYKVAVYERRPDMRSAKISAGRSINLALSDRGLRALDMVGIKDKVEELVIPMVGRMIHPMEGASAKVNYSGRDGEWINSISRGGLNILLLNEAEATGNISFRFNAECSHIDFDNGLLSIEDKVTGENFIVQGDVIFGTDGASSAVRKSIMDFSPKYRFDYQQKYLDTGYKELEIPAWPNGEYRLDEHALHIWPRPGFMMIALPNKDGSFTVTLFMPFEGQNGFNSLLSESEISEFFNKYFKSAYDQMPDLMNDFATNPSSALGTIKCYPWQINGKYLLMGDAAHAIVPFYGQGMNASFEDVIVLDELIDKHEGQWDVILDQFQTIRKIDTDAIADLAQDNFYEMRDGTADPIFMLKRKIELHLEQTDKNYYSKYSMVTFRADLPYHEAMRKGRIQDEILMNYAREVGQWENVNIDIIRSKLGLDSLS